MVSSEQIEELLNQFELDKKILTEEISYLKGELKSLVDNLEFLKKEALLKKTQFEMENYNYFLKNLENSFFNRISELFKTPQFKQRLLESLKFKND